MADTPDIHTPLRLNLAQNSLVSCFEPGLARNDTCLICLDNWDSELGQHHQLIVHAACQQFFHEGCFSTWYENCYRQDIPPRCPLCAGQIPIHDIYLWRSLRDQARSLQTDLKFQEKRLLWMFEDMYSELMGLLSQAKPVSSAGIRPGDLAVSLHVTSTGLHNLIRVRMHSQYAHILRLIATNLFQIAEQSMLEIVNTTPAIDIVAYTAIESHLSSQFSNFTRTMLNTICAGPRRNQTLTTALFRWRDICFTQEESYDYSSEINPSTALILSNQFHAFTDTTLNTQIQSLSTSLTTTITSLIRTLSDSRLFATDASMTFYYPTLFDNYLQQIAVLRTTFEAEAEQDRVDDEAFRRDIQNMLRDIAEYRRTGRITPIRRRMVNRRLKPIMEEWGHWNVWKI